MDRSGRAVLDGELSKVFDAERFGGIEGLVKVRGAGGPLQTPRGSLLLPAPAGFGKARHPLAPQGDDGRGWAADGQREQRGSS